MMKFRCVKCRQENKLPFEFETTLLPAVCPRCGKETPRQLAVIHLIVLGSGPLYSSTGGKQHLACCPTRDYIANLVNREGGTPNPMAVTCAVCMRTRTWQDMALAAMGKPKVQRRKRLRVAPFLSAK